MLHNVIAIISVFMVLLTMFERVFRQKRRGIKANLLCRHHIMWCCWLITYWPTALIGRKFGERP